MGVLELSALLSGIAIGLSVTVPVGPMAILCIQRTLARGVRAGLSTGAGASTVQVAYASVVLLGFQHVAPFLDDNRMAMGGASAGLMLFFAWRLLGLGDARRRAAGRALYVPGMEAGSVVRNYGSAIAFNCLNPMLLVLLVGAVGAIVGPEPPLGPAVSMVLAGVFAGSAGWWVVLTLATAAFRGRVGPGVLRGINRAAAAAMVGFAVLSVARSFGA